VLPFRAIRYAAASGPLAELVSPPYDVIDAAERARLANLHPANVIHVLLPEGPDAYRRAAERLATWIKTGVLAQDSEPAVFLCAQRFTIHARTFERFGLIAALKLEPLDGGVVLPHERTLAAPKADRLNLIRACRMNLSPIFGLVDAPLELAALAERAQPIATFGDQAGVVHRFWQIEDPQVHDALQRRFSPLQVFIADGHHRYETSLAYRAERRAAEGEPPAHQSYDFVLAYLCSTLDPGLVVLPTHRLLRDAPPEAELSARLANGCSLTRFGSPEELAEAIGRPARAAGPQRVGVLRHGARACWLVEASQDASRALAALPSELARLDVSFLHEVVLPGIPADRFTYTHDDVEAISAVATGEATLGVLLPAPRVSDVLAISRAGLTMPQKSTYFHPKVLSGLAFHSLD
jgi:uncharacterized protein (DUF1015 family)